jgi:phosphoinositide-3-kinase regulatory subunit 4
VFKIEYTTKKDSTLNRYSVATVKNLDSTGGAIMALDHYNTDNESIIIYATNKGGIHGWDLRAKKEAYVLSNPPDLGLLETFVFEPGKNWLVSGTGSGYFTCWDMRFHIPVKSWRHPAKTRIFKLAHYNTQKNGSWIYCTSGVSNDFSVWDVETASCKQLFRILQTDDPVPVPSLKVL